MESFIFTFAELTLEIVKNKGVGDLFSMNAIHSHWWIIYYVIMELDVMHLANWDDGLLYNW